MPSQNCHVKAAPLLYGVLTYRVDSLGHDLNWGIETQGATRSGQVVALRLGIAEGGYACETDISSPRRRPFRADRDRCSGACQYEPPIVRSPGPGIRRA